MKTVFIMPNPLCLIYALRSIFHLKHLSFIRKFSAMRILNYPRLFVINHMDEQTGRFFLFPIGSNVRVCLSIWIILFLALAAFAQPMQEDVEDRTLWLEELTNARHEAVAQVLASSESEQPFLRANAVETAEYLSPTHPVEPLIRRGLNDSHPSVRFAALVIVEKLKLCDMEPMVRQLSADASQSVRVATLFALHACRKDVDLSSITRALASSNPTSRSNAAMLLGHLGNRSAVPMLKDLAKKPMPRARSVDQALVRIQIAEAIVKLGDDSALNAIRAGAYSQFDEVRVLAVTMLGQLRDRRMEKAIAHMLLPPPIELQVAAATSLVQLGHKDGLPIVLQATKSDLVTVRAQAALALAYFPYKSSAQAILRLCRDPEEQVRLSAAAAVLRATATQ